MIIVNESRSCCHKFPAHILYTAEINTVTPAVQTYRTSIVPQLTGGRYTGRRGRYRLMSFNELISELIDCKLGNVHRIEIYFPYYISGQRVHRRASDAGRQDLIIVLLGPIRRKSAPQARTREAVFIYFIIFCLIRVFYFAKIKIPDHYAAIGDFVLVRLQGLEPGAH